MNVRLQIESSSIVSLLESSAFMLDLVSGGYLVSLLFAGVVCACGGSQQKTSVAANPAVLASTTSSAKGTASTTNQRPPQHNRHPRHGSQSAHVAKASNVRLPATYVIGRGGVLSPPLVSAPASVKIDLTVISSDGFAHRVRLRRANVPALIVPAGGRASALLGGLTSGSYAVYVDRIRRGALVIGVAPGP